MTDEPHPLPDDLPANFPGGEAIRSALRSSELLGANFAYVEAAMFKAGWSWERVAFAARQCGGDTVGAERWAAILGWATGFAEGFHVCAEAVAAGTIGFNA